MALPGFRTSDGGMKYSGFQGPVLAGKMADGMLASLPAAGGFICVQSTASIDNQIVTTSANGLSRASFIYIPVSTASLVGAAAPAYAGVGTALTWDDATKTLQVWSSGSASWMTLIATTSMAKGGFTTSQ